MKVVLIGAGNLAYHLGQQLHKSDVNLVQIFSRTKEKALRLSEYTEGTSYTTDLSAIYPDADIYILAVHDDAIAEVAQKLRYLAKRGKFIVHTSGATPATVFAPLFPTFGVLYPFQSFSIDREMNFKEVPICIYANGAKEMLLLAKLGENLGCQTFPIDDKQRGILHINGVFVNNFTNHLYQMAWNISEVENIPFELLRPLIKETAAKVMQHPPASMQTGPAARGDQQSIERHLAYLEKWPAYSKIYTLLSSSIKKSQQI